MYIQCSHCGEEITPDSDFCPHCGVLFTGAAAEHCDVHPERPAAKICIICRKLVCESCARLVRGRSFCSDHQTVEVQQDWARIHESTEINESELIKSFLETAGYKVQLQNFTPVGFVWDGGGDSSISRSNLSKPAKIFVPIPEFLEAAESLKEWKSGASEDVDLDTNES